MDELAAAVNDIKSMITLTGLVRAAVDDAFTSRVTPLIEPAMLTNASQDSCPKVKKKKKNKKKSNVINGNVNNRNAVPNSDSSNKKSDNSQLPIRLDEISIEETDKPANSSSPNASIVSLDSTIIENVLNVQSVNLPTRNPNTNHGIRIADKRIYIWLSGFHHTSTAQQVVSFVSRVLSVEEKEIVCRSLKSGHRTYTDFHHVSFRIGLRSTYANEALQPNKWPTGISCKLFNQKN